MKTHTLVEIVLIAVLVFWGRMLVDSMRSSSGLAREVTEANARLNFRSGKGISVDGRLFDPKGAEGKKRILAFLVRGETLSADLAYWRQVADAIPEGSDVSVVGYCDGRACAEALRRSPPVLPDITILEYAEVVDAQALINADTAGNALLRGAAIRARIIPWRKQVQTPEQLVRSIRR